MFFHGFKGGIHPPECKETTKNREFTSLSIPHICYIPMKQHSGNPALPVVKVGDFVYEGQLIGRADGEISASIHASIPGKIIDISDSYDSLSGGLCVVIEAEGSFMTFGKTASAPGLKEMDKDNIIRKVKDAGIVGMGGQGFPTSIKLSAAAEKNIDTLIINGVESEPYLSSDVMLMRTFPDEIIEGAAIALTATGAGRAIIAIEKNRHEAITSLKESAGKSVIAEKIEIRPLSPRYPLGAERQLIRSILGKKIPARMDPIDFGVAVINAGTIYAIRDAVLFGKPLFERYVTAAGSLVNRPGNYKARTGIRISDFIEDIGGLKGKPARIIMGGPMRGAMVQSMDVPITKETTGLLFLTEKESANLDYSACIRCGRCVSACPSGLVPGMIARAVEMNRSDIAMALHPLDCITCNSCSYVCPSGRPVSRLIFQCREGQRPPDAGGTGR
jgi:electron transport complex protein RnfC